MNFLIFHLECNAADDVLAWADQVLQMHQKRRAIVTTHMGLGPRERPKTPEGHSFVAESFFDDDHDDRIVEFDASFRHLRSYRVKFRSPCGIRGIEYLPATDQFQIQSHGRLFYRIDADFDSASLRLGEADV
jgi:hypothetical protein